MMTIANTVLYLWKFLRKEILKVLITRKKTYKHVWMDGNYIYYTNHLVIYTYIESLCCISIINIFYVNSFQLKTAYCLQETHLRLKDKNMLNEKERKRFCKQWVTKYSRNVRKKKLDFNHKEIKWNKWEWSVFLLDQQRWILHEAITLYIYLWASPVAQQ